MFRKLFLRHPASSPYLFNSSPHLPCIIIILVHCFLHFSKPEIKKPTKRTINKSTADATDLFISVLPVPSSIILNSTHNKLLAAAAGPWNLLSHSPGSATPHSLFNCVPLKFILISFFFVHGKSSVPVPVLLQSMPCDIWCIQFPVTLFLYRLQDIFRSQDNILCDFHDFSLIQAFIFFRDFCLSPINNAFRP